MKTYFNVKISSLLHCASVSPHSPNKGYTGRKKMRTNSVKVARWKRKTEIALSEKQTNRQKKTEDRTVPQNFQAARLQTGDAIY